MRSILGSDIDDGYDYLRNVFAQTQFEGVRELTVDDYRAIEEALLDDRIDLSTQVRAALTFIGFFDAPVRPAPSA